MQRGLHAGCRKRDTLTTAANERSSFPQAEPYAPAGSGEHPYPARSSFGIREAGDALLDRQGFLGHVAAGAEGFLSGSDSIPPAAYRHGVQIRGDAHVPR